jgi:hypothetical protein
MASAFKAQPELCEDPGADHLDALARAWQTGLDGFRNLIDPLEGWIANPSPAFPVRMRSDVSPKFLEKG